MILVVGATGTTGNMIVKKLLERGESVRAFVREESEHAALEEAGAEIAIGDLKQAMSVRQAMEGVDRVVTTATASARSGEDTIEAVDRIGTASLIEASREAGIKRFVYVSAWGFDKDLPIAIARAKTESEQRLVESGVPYTILKPCLFMDVWIGWVIGSQLQNDSKVVIVDDKGAKFGFVAAENVADLAVAALDEPQAENATITLCSDVATFPDIVKRIEKMTGRSLAVETVAPDSLEGFPPVVGELWSRMSEKEAPAPTEGVHQAFGIHPITIDDFLKRAFGGSK